VSKGEKRRERVAAQGGPKARSGHSEKRAEQSGFPWPEWLSMPVLAAFGLGVVIGGTWILVLGLVLIPIAFVLAALPFVRFVTPAMAVAFAAGVLLIGLLAPTDLKVPLGIAGLIALGIATGHYVSRRLLAPMLARRQS
jgi:hypothetical protein